MGSSSDEQRRQTSWKLYQLGHVHNVHTAVYYCYLRRAIASHRVRVQEITAPTRKAATQKAPYAGRATILTSGLGAEMVSGRIQIVSPEPRSEDPKPGNQHPLPPLPPSTTQMRASIRRPSLEVLGSVAQPRTALPAVGGGPTSPLWPWQLQREA